MHKAVQKLEKELGANLIAVGSSRGQGKGHIRKLQDATTFLARNGAPYVLPDAMPLTYPIIPPRASTAEQEHLCAENETAQTEWQTLQHVRHIAINLIADAIKLVYYAELNDPDEGLNDVLVRDLIDHIRDRYCQIDQSNIDKNMETFQQGIDPTQLLSVYIRKQENCQDFVNNARVPISKQTMVTTGTKHALQCGDFTVA